MQKFYEVLAGTPSCTHFSPKSKSIFCILNFLRKKKQFRKQKKLFNSRRFFLFLDFAYDVHIVRKTCVTEILPIKDGDAVKLTWCSVFEACYQP